MNENEQRELIEEFARMDEHSVEIAKECILMANTDAWRLLQALIEQRVREVGDRALDDQDAEHPKPSGYWRGFRDGSAGLRDIFTQMTAISRRLSAVRQQFSAPDFELGSGDPSVE
ncbi:MAG: hypothetical protein BMS9Abin37_2045 [Acidobacteriota bacterium]|nr:MAG: hypothetical protein BMS9Abin37_2045 [Acidobacteriota bacterium]